MPTNAVLLKVDGERVVLAVEEALAKLESAQGEVILDFSSVRRIDPDALQALESLVSRNGSATKVVLRGVSVDVYKVLKLMKLAPRLTFLG